MTETHEELTAFQVEVAQLFFSLPESDGFLLAGGAGLLAQQLTHRRTQDLDFFTRHSHAVATARDALAAIAEERGWSVAVVQDGDTFCRLTVSNDEALLVDLAMDSPPLLPPTLSFLGPTFAPEELAARKLLALFDRAEARDFADVYELVRTFDRNELVDHAAQIDLGFTTDLLAVSMAALARFKDTDIPIRASDVPALRDYFARWVASLREG